MNSSFSTQSLNPLIQDVKCVSEHDIDWLSERETTGTTLVALEFDEGVVIAADSRTSSGSLVVHRCTDKLTKLTDHIYCLRSGSAADTQNIADIVRYQLSYYEMETGEKPRVRIAANLFRDILYEYRNDLTAAIVCAGWDEKEGGQLYTLPLGGMLLRRSYCLDGSGSTYISGYVDGNYKRGLSREECIKMAVNGVSLAIGRDGSSGGVIRLGVITKKGIERSVITGDDIPKFFGSV